MKFEQENSPIDLESILTKYSFQIKEKYLDLKSIFEQKQKEAGANNRLLDWYEDNVIFLDNLKKLYPDAADYLFYHILCGSTPPAGLTEIDFPEDDSIEKYIKNLSA